MDTLGGNAPGLDSRPWLATAPDGVELSSFNGRPSAGLVATDFGALLFWQFFGHGSDIGLWLYLPLTDEEAEYVVDHPEEPLLEGIHEQLEGRQGVLALSNAGWVQARGPFNVAPQKPGSSLVTQMLEALSLGLNRAYKARTRSGRAVEFASGSEKVTNAAKAMVHDTLTGCPS
ncbi:hypothetical protein [Amycolatopsis vancoresmycina]|uniref:hypothetical protein n=1 Tax=Amycolatopsis vancoresmycina TaxID=208444 RepID=UPI00138E0CDB|nr:hypothetical protein [Amycolatopsis vancoresmycina]